MGSIYIDYTETPFYFDVIKDVYIVPTEENTIEILGLIEGEGQTMKIKITHAEDVPTIKDELTEHIGKITVHQNDFYKRTYH